MDLMMIIYLTFRTVFMAIMVKLKNADTEKQLDAELRKKSKNNQVDYNDRCTKNKKKYPYTEDI